MRGGVVGGTQIAPNAMQVTVIYSDSEERDLESENGQESKVNGSDPLNFVNPDQPLGHFRAPPKNASGFPIKQWSKSSESPPRYSPWVIRPR